MISGADRKQAVILIEEAVASGARRFKACEPLGLSLRPYQRWQHSPEDRRVEAIRPEPKNKLSTEERSAIIEMINRPEHASLPPHQIVPRLADQGLYLASESSFYRVMREYGQQNHRGRAKAQEKRVITTHRATKPNQIWVWDISWLPSAVRGQFYYWYMVKDVFSRKVVASEVHLTESSALAAELLKRGTLKEGIFGESIILHSDNGSPMKGSTMLATMQSLGVMPSFSRPRVSNDNAYAETLFRTAKYCPMWPSKPFESLEDARQWVDRFVHWYNEEHRHSGIGFVTPEERHRGEAEELLQRRHRVYTAAKARHPHRWTGKTRNWTVENEVFLNPERSDKSTR